MGDKREFPQEMAKEREYHCITEENFSTTREVFDQASNAYVALYYHCGWRGGCYRNDASLESLTS